MKLLNPLQKRSWPTPSVPVSVPATMADTPVDGISAVNNAMLLNILADGATLQPFNFLARETALGMPAFSRSITLLSGLMGQLLTRGSLYVYRMDTGDRITTRAAQEALYLLAETPDGETPAQPFIEDVAVDYLIDGNALIVPDRSMTRTTKLQRALADQAVRMARGVSTLSIPLADGDTVTRARRDVILVRWPKTYSHATGLRSTGYARKDFAPSNVDILRHVLHIGLASDQHIAEFFKAVRGKRHVNFAIGLQRFIQPEQMEQVRLAVEKQIKKGGPYVFGDSAQFMNLNEQASSAASETLRKMQARQVATYFGVPPMLVGEETTSWGSGIEELSRGFVRYGLQQHLSRFLDPFSLNMLPRGQKFGVEQSAMIAVSIEALTKLATIAAGDTQRPPFMVQEEIRALFGMAPNTAVPRTPYKPPQSSRAPMRPAPLPPEEEDPNAG